ncbi:MULTISPECIES: pitrilysin family protein [unclassified Methylophilus]|uniref:M16 family metallopeptidase n=1 Tax=unclassified Methylophilus TaxID=2630143 RepID=UPI0006FA5AD4|nr:peptidase M16 [Methylophilus sp. Leaf416]KQT59237.1 peptidase M16 [Methylophilus sp. Leaf459]
MTKSFPMRNQAILILATLLSASHLQAAEIVQTTLKNGLKVIVQEDHRAPVVVSQVWYRAGSLDEVNGKTGVAHVLEHMMFKGTKKVPAGQFSRQVAAAGGKENAFTSKDYTCYFQQLEKSKLPLSFKLEADRMANLQITDAEFAKEIEVVKEERRWRTEDKPQSRVNEQFEASSYRAHPYGRPVVGFMNDLDNMTAQDARDWYNTWYTPNNVTVVVVGDVNAKEVFKLAQDTFGKLAAKPLPVRKPQVEPAQLGERRAIVKAPAKLPYFTMGFHAPAMKNGSAYNEQDWEPYALEVLSSILSGNDASRLNQKLVREQAIALDVDSGYDGTNRGQESMFEIAASPSEGVALEALQKAIWELVEEVKNKGVTAAELHRVKAAVIAADVYKRDSMFYQAMQIGQLETMGYPLSLLEKNAARVQAVTSEQVQTVARKYLVPDQMTLVTLDPQPMDPNAKPAGRPHQH